MIGFALALHVASGHSEYVRVADETARLYVAPISAPHWTPSGSRFWESMPTAIVLTRRDIVMTRDVEQSIIAATRESAKLLYSLKVPPKIT